MFKQLFILCISNEGRVWYAKNLKLSGRMQILRIRLHVFSPNPFTVHSKIHIIRLLFPVEHSPENIPKRRRKRSFTFFRIHSWWNVRPIIGIWNDFSNTKFLLSKTECRIPRSCWLNLSFDPTFGIVRATEPPEWGWPRKCRIRLVNLKSLD